MWSSIILGLDLPLLISSAINSVFVVVIPAAAAAAAAACVNSSNVSLN